MEEAGTRNGRGRDLEWKRQRHVTTLRIEGPESCRYAEVNSPIAWRKAGVLDIGSWGLA